MYEVMVLFGFVAMMAKDIRLATMTLMWALMSWGWGATGYRKEDHRTGNENLLYYQKPVSMNSLKAGYSEIINLEISYDIVVVKNIDC